MNGTLKRDLAIILGLAAVFALVPQVLDNRYYITTLTLFFIWAIVVGQWNLVLGVAGIFSLGQMAIFAVGAYGTAMLGYYLEMPIWAAMLWAAAAAVLLSLLMGLACLRLQGPYVALLTLAFVQIMSLAIVNDTACFTNPPSGCLPLFGGVRGFSRFGDLGFRELLGPGWYLGQYYVGLALFIAALVFTVVICRGPLGLAFVALRDQPGLAAARGISKLRYQLWVFGLSAFFTGMAGAFHATQFGVVGPTVLSLTTLLFLLAMMIIGGVGTVWGPLMGVALVMLADEAMQEVGDYRAIGLAALMAGFVVLLPKGLSGLVRRADR